MLTAQVIGAVKPPMSQRTRVTSEEPLQAVLASLDRLESSLPKPRESQSQWLYFKALLSILLMPYNLY